MNENANESPRPEIRVGDAERQKAMERLGNFFADGFLDIDEFNERTEAAAGARHRTELDSLFADLPSEPNGLANTSSATTGELDKESPDSELQALLEKGERLKIYDGLASAIGIITVGLLIFTDLDFIWVGFVVAMATSLIGRTVLGISDDEKEILDEITDEESKRRAERLRIAAEKRRQIEQRKDPS